MDTKNAYPLIECDVNYKLESGEICKLKQFDEKKNYYVDAIENSLIIKISKEGKETVKIIDNKDVVTGYYFNDDKTAVVCVNGKGCIEGYYGNYIINNCKDENFGLIVNKPNEDDLYLCSALEIDKFKSGVYIIKVNSKTFPDTPNEGLALIEYNYINKTFLKIDGSDHCTEDGQIIFNNNEYYYCTNVIIHETFENDGVTMIDNLTRYESVPISMNSIGSSFVMKFGTEYKVVNIEENGKITMNYGK